MARLRFKSVVSYGNSLGDIWFEFIAVIKIKLEMGNVYIALNCHRKCITTMTITAAAENNT